MARVITGIRKLGREIVADGRRFWHRFSRKTCSGSREGQPVAYGTCDSEPSSIPNILFASFDGAQAAANISLDLPRSYAASYVSESSTDVLLPPMPDRLPKAYDLVRTLNGKLGHFNTPIHLVRQRNSGKLFIIKQVIDDKAPDWPKEAGLLSELAHPNIIGLESVHIDRNGATPIVNIVLQYCDGGDVQDFLNSQCAVHEKVPLPFVLHFASSMIDALSFVHHGITYDADADQFRRCHQPSMIHRDLKPKNIFLDKSHRAENGLPRVVVADFGLSTIAEENQGTCGTAGYLAPEVTRTILECQRPDLSYALRMAIFHQPIMSTANDWWAFGCCLYQALTGDLYRPGMEARSRILESAAGTHPELYQLINSCLQTDPRARPRGIDIRLHRLSASFKAQLQRWHDRGGRLPEDIWPEAFRFERAEKAGEPGVVCASTSACLLGEASAVAGAFHAHPDMRVDLNMDYVSRL
ncbi:Putative serine/threonine-protein kinase, active [Septoria linicola]|uniref:non-specific serine/threonine protein kinase n=1 Tax=Septoria linicola TaxID=215465 RepID=A0A9Q9ALR8_9PEZI|nr:Putative serine/threonine-protein kinase, active [Septoria linicola]